MNECILLVGHGSRNVKGNQEIDQFAELWRSNNPQWHIETCFIEFADVLLDQGLENAAKGSDRVIVVPLILNAAGHVKMEIPAHLSNARSRYKNTEFVYAPHLGACDSILKILKRRLRQTMLELDMPDPKTSGVILLGRGSSDRVANGEFAKMARWMFEESDHELVDIAFTGITYPRLESVVQRQVKLGMTQIAIIPYYLFTGTLIERIKNQTKHLQQQYPQIRFSTSQYFGFEPEIYDILNERVTQAQGGSSSTIMMECDGCHYRELAEQAGHGHQHNHDHGAHDHSHEQHTEHTQEGVSA